VALADTAKLVASLELQDKFSKPLAGASTSLDNFARKTATLDKLGNDIGRGIRNTATNLTRIGIAGAGLLTAAVTNGVRELEKLENAQAQTNAVIESTQGVAGQTAESIRNLAEKYEGLNATVDDKVIQSTENLLLTFTNVKKEAFEPALQAILDINTAMGGGEEGLEGVAIQVGKALNDPIRGLTALRRIGVNFTEQQKDQIKKLVEANDLYGAQQIILQELGTEFGGSFAAAGDTAAGKFAKVRDAVEDAQAALATAFLPVLEKVADKLGTFLSDPATVQRIEDFGGQLAAGFDKALDVIGQIDFGAIGASLEIAGTGAKAVFDAFVNLPPWVQTAVLTGWGLNKLTGGALTGIVGTLSKVTFGGLFERGSSAANPLWVQSVGGVGGPGGLPLEVGGGALLVALTAGTIAALGVAFVASQLVPQDPFARPGDVITPGRGFGPPALHGPRTSNTPLSRVETSAAVREGTTQLAAEQEAMTEKIGTEAAKQVNAVNALKIPLGFGNIIAQQIKDKAEATIQKNASILDSLRGQAGSLIRLEEKKFDPTVNVNVAATANISVSNVSRTLTSFRIAGTTTLGGFTASAFE
jgi:hypothetical protein